MTAPDRSLQRSITLPQLVLYGLGTTIGAGIYALTGEVAGLAGHGAPLAFVLASLLAGFTALSFAELSGRYPRAAGAAIYVENGFGWQPLATAVGCLVALAGMVSAAALVNAFVSQAANFVTLPRAAAIALMCGLITAIAAKGIRESIWTAAIITLVEISGLLLVVMASAPAWSNLPDYASRLQSDGIPTAGLFMAALLAFYAFIGFEDMVDVTEEVRSPVRTMPRAILLTLVCVTVLYALVMLAAVLAVPPQELAQQPAPLVYIYTHYQGGDGHLLAVISLFAIINGALIQTVMASRVIYGLSSRGQLPAVLSSVHPKTRTPLLATALVGVLLLVLAMMGRLAGLAEVTSVLMLSVFTLVNLALLRIKWRGDSASGFSVPLLVPLLGSVSCLGFVLLRLAH